MKRFAVSLFLAGCAVAGVPSARAQDLLVGEYYTNRILRITPGGTQTVFAQPSVPSGTRLDGFAFDQSGNLYAARLHGSDANPNNPNNGIIKITPTGVVSAFASFVPGLPNELALDASGNVYASSVSGGQIRRYSPTGADLGVFATVSGEGDGLIFDGTGTLFVALRNANQVRRFSATGADLGVFATVTQADCMAFDPAGNLLIGTRNGVINRYSATGTNLGVFASVAGADFNGLAVADNGEVFATNFAGSGDVRRFSAMGTALGTFGTGIASPIGIAFVPSASAAAPEPSGLALLALPLIGAIARRRRSRA